MARTTMRATRAWEAIEEHFPPAGVRSRMSALLGKASLAALERAGVIGVGPVATTFPCPTPCPEGCPRQVLDNGDGTYTALCDIDSDESVLPEDEARLLLLDRDRFTALLRSTLGITGRHEWLVGLSNVCRLGAHVPAPGVRSPIFFVVRCSPAEYATAFDILRAQTGGTAFAVVVLTRRHVTHDLERRLSDTGSVLVALNEVLDIQAEGLRPLVDPGMLFGGIGQVPTTHAGKAPVVARALIGRGRRFSWRDLDQEAYDELVIQKAEFDIFADELTRTCFKRGEWRERIKPAHFKIWRAAIERRSKFDPVTDIPEDLRAGQQTLQRAREVFDIGKRRSWKLLKTDSSGESAAYDFSPDPDVSFVFIFAPSK